MLRSRGVSRRYVLMAAASVVIALTMTVLSTLVASAAPPAPTWSDDFDGPAGSAPDPARWTHETGGSGFGNNELEYYTDDPSNAQLDGQGHLVITARRDNSADNHCWYGACQYTSARLTTSGRFEQKYGRFEARIKLPRGQGLWPAFWMLGNDIGRVGWPGSGEIDIMENIGREPSVVHGSLHGPGYSGGSPLTGSFDLGSAFANDFHTFAVDWSPEAVAFSVDGKEYERKTPADTHGRAWVFNHPFFIILNLAVGGAFPGSPDGTTAFPQQMVVDYVHVFSNGGAAGDGKPGIASTPSMTASVRMDAPPSTQNGGQAALPGGGAIIGYWGKCVNVASGRRDNETQVQLSTCNGTPAQQWTRMGSSIRALNKCLDLAAGQPADGAGAALSDCDGAAGQAWTYTDGEFVNAQSGKCLAASDLSGADGTPLQARTCDGGPGQRFLTLDSVDPAPSSRSPATGSSDGSVPPATTANAAAGRMAAAPYLYLGWGDPPDPRTVMSATGVKWFTLAFMLDAGGCKPRWDGNRPLTGGADQAAIAAIRAAGGDVVVSFGGASGPSLEQACGSADALASAYRTVIDAYGLHAIDIDIEGGVYGDPSDQQRTIDALKLIKSSRPGVTIYVTIPSDRTGPDASMINRAARAGLTVDGWTIMPFDFGAAGQDMGALTIEAAEGLKNVVKSAYRYSDDQAYRHAGISSMNGKTDAGETVTQGNFSAILAYARQHHLARFTFWSANRDRPCHGGAADSCSGVGQAPWDFTRIVARYAG